MTCECISQIDKLLAPHNTRLGLTIVFGSPMTTLPTLEVEQIEKGRGKPRAKTIFPSFCPFCGVKYKADEDAPRSGPSSLDTSKSTETPLQGVGDVLRGLQGEANG